MRSFLAAVLLTVVPTTALAALPFLEDDWPGALAQAKARRRPIVVDAWAPW